MTICLLLAAGSSSRMGKPKMLLPYNGKTFLQKIVDEIQKLDNALLLVITGCYHSLLNKILTKQHIAFVQCEDWEQGMGASIQTGINYVLQHYTNADNIIILVCDQPYISSGLLQEMIDTTRSTSKGIIACAYAGTTGTPVLFDKKYFSELAMLDGQQGAKKILQQFAADVSPIMFPEGIIDIDNPEDYERFMNKKSGGS